MSPRAAPRRDARWTRLLALCGVLVLFEAFCTRGPAAISARAPRASRRPDALAPSLAFRNVLATVPTGRRPSSVAVGDFDRDGRSDLAVANYDDDTISVLLGRG